MSTPLGLVEKIDEILKEHIDPTYSAAEGIAEQHLAEAQQAILQAVIEWAEGLIGSDDKIEMVHGNRKGNQPMSKYRYIKAADMPKYYRNKLRAKQRAMLNELKGE